MAAQPKRSREKAAEQSTGERLERLAELTREIEVLEERLHRVDANQDKVRPEVYAKVRGEYEKQLVEARAAAEPLHQLLSDQREEARLLEQELASLVDARSLEHEELMLRHLAGEISDAHYEREESHLAKELGGLNEKLAAVRENLNAMAQALNGQVEPLPVPVAPAAPVVVPPPVARAAPTPPAAPVVPPPAVRAAPAPPAPPPAIPAPAARPAPVMAPVAQPPAVEAEDEEEEDLEDLTGVDDLDFGGPGEPEALEPLPPAPPAAGRPRAPAEKPREPEVPRPSPPLPSAVEELEDLGSFAEAFGEADEDDEGVAKTQLAAGVSPRAEAFEEPEESATTVDARGRASDTGARDDYDLDLPEDLLGEEEGEEAGDLFAEAARGKTKDSGGKAGYIEDLEDLDEEDLLADLDEDGGARTLSGPVFEAPEERVEREKPVVAPTSSPVLVVEDGEPKGVVFPVNKDLITIGRGPDNDIQLANDTSISRHHARVSREDDEFVVIDLQSSNGTIVNGQQVTRKVLADQDRILIGQTLLCFATGMPQR